MVVFHIKNGEEDGFLYEVSCETSVDVAIREIVQIWNLRIRLGQLSGGLTELAMYGPMKKPDKVGLDTVEEKYNGAVIDKNEHYQPDPTGNRTGNGVGPQLSETFERVIVDTRTVLDPNLVKRRQAVSLANLQERLDNIRGATMMAFPMGLPEWDTIRLTIESEQGLDGTAASTQLLDEATAELWVASRMFDRNTKISDRLGRNDKTKVIGKLQKPGAGAPGREAVVNEEEKKAMMAHYFKKQEEEKRMAESSEDDYLHSSWADPKAMQRSMRGMGDIKGLPGLR